MNDLSHHEEICAQRYLEVDRRLTNVEDKLDKLSDKIDQNFKTMTFMIVGAMGAVGTLVGIIVAVIGVN